MTNEPMPTTTRPLPEVETAARLPAGFRVAGGYAGIKDSGRSDLGIVVAEAPPLPVAATFTTNRLASAPVRMDRSHLARTGGDAGAYGRVSAMMVTSGCANAATGEAGDADQRRLADHLASLVGRPVEEILAMSTGLIGTRLPVPAIESALSSLVADELADDDASWAAVADSMRTTDSVTKAASVVVTLPDAAGGDVKVTIGGVAKGVGMIHPSMATMLSFVLTDATVDARTLHELLRPIVVRTWDQTSVDGDQSTSDTVLLTASGAAGAAPLPDAGPARDRFAAGLEAVARSLARQQAADGEGASRLITCLVGGGADEAAARGVAREVVRSPLVKAAVHGSDPNWGRMIAAIGNAVYAAAEVLEAGGMDAADAVALGGSPIAVDIDRLRIDVCGIPVFAGAPLPYDEADASRRMDADEVVFAIDLGAGDGRGEAFGCDLTEAYVVENSAYST